MHGFSLNTHYVTLNFVESDNTEQNVAKMASCKGKGHSLTRYVAEFSPWDREPLHCPKKYFVQVWGLPTCAREVWKQRLILKSHQYVGGFYTRNNLRPFAGFVVEENSVREITWLPCRYHVISVSRSLLSETPFSKGFPSTRKRKAVVFKFFLFEERFRKALFLWQIIVDGRPNRLKSWEGLKHLLLRITKIILFLLTSFSLFLT